MSRCTFVVCLFALQASFHSPALASDAVLDGAAFIRQTLPARLTVGNSAIVTVTFRNTGLTTWTPKDYALRVLPRNPGESWWKRTPVLLNGDVPPGQEVTFTFWISTPPFGGDSGLLPFSTRMVRMKDAWLPDGTRIESQFGAASPQAGILIRNAGNSGLFVKFGTGFPPRFGYSNMTVPGTMSPGEKATIRIEVMNSGHWGDAPWPAGTYALVSQTSHEVSWGVDNVRLSEDVWPGQHTAVDLTITAPLTPGLYPFQWRLAQLGVETFGSHTPPRFIRVLGPAPAIQSTNPRTGPPRGGMDIRIEGTNLQPGSRVFFGDVPATHVLVQNGATITARTPAHPSGLVEVKVVGPDGQEARLPYFFKFQTATLGLRAEGDGRGLMYSTLQSCSQSCDSASDVPLAIGAVGETASAFGGWAGWQDCFDGIVAMDSDLTCNARFTTTVDTAIADWAVDINGDGRGDVFMYDELSGRYMISFGGGAGRPGHVSGLWAPGWTIKPGDLDGDRATDLLLYNKASGQFFVATSLRNGTFTFFGYRWAPGWDVLVADFNADRQDDVFLYSPISGQYFFGISNASPDFAYSSGRLDPGEQMVVANWNADARADLFAIDKATGEWERLTTTPDYKFLREHGAIRWATSWRIHPGDFNGDTITDLMLYGVGGRTAIATALPVGFGYEYYLWGGDWSVRPADLNGDSVTDLFLYDPSTGRWARGERTPGSFSFTYGSWGGGWQIQPTDFNADGRADLLLYNPSSNWGSFALSTPLGTFELMGVADWQAGFTPIAWRQDIDAAKEPVRVRQTYALQGAGIVHVTGASFRAGSATVVEFVDAAGRKFAVPAESVSGTEIAVRAPVSFDAKPVTYAVTVVQTFGGGSVRRSAGVVTVSPAPVRQYSPPGALAMYHLEMARYVLAHSSIQWTKLATANRGLIDLAPVQQLIAAQAAEIDRAISSLRALMDGRVSTLWVGTIGDRQLTITAADLPTLDQAFVAAEASGPLSANPAASTLQAAFSANATTGPLASPEQWAKFYQVARTQQAVSTWGLAAIGAMTGGAGLATPVGQAAAAVFVVSTAAPAIVGYTTYAMGLALGRRDEALLRETNKFLFESLTQLALSKGVDKLLGRMFGSATDLAAEALKRMNDDLLATPAVLAAEDPWGLSSRPLSTDPDHPIADEKEDADHCSTGHFVCPNGNPWEFCTHPEKYMCVRS